MKADLAICKPYFLLFSVCVCMCGGGTRGGHTQRCSELTPREVLGSDTICWGWNLGQLCARHTLLRYYIHLLIFLCLKLCLKSYYKVAHNTVSGNQCPATNPTTSMTFPPPLFQVFPLCSQFSTFPKLAPLSWHKAIYFNCLFQHISHSQW